MSLYVLLLVYFLQGDLVETHSITAYSLQECMFASHAIQLADRDERIPVGPKRMAVKKIIGKCIQITDDEVKDGDAS